LLHVPSILLPFFFCTLPLCHFFLPVFDSLCVLVCRGTPSLCVLVSGADIGASWTHLFSHVGRRRRATRVHARRPVATQLRVRRRDRGVPAGSENGSRLCDGVLGRSARVRSAALAER